MGNSKSVVSQETHDINDTYSDTDVSDISEEESGSRRSNHPIINKESPWKPHEDSWLESHFGDIFA